MTPLSLLAGRTIVRPQSNAYENKDQTQNSHNQWELYIVRAR